LNLAENKRYLQIGLDRLIQIKWLEKTANLVLAGADYKSIKAMLQEDLLDSFQSKNVEVRGSIDKTITILTKVWYKPPKNLTSFQQNGLELLSSLQSKYHIAVHWGMIMAVYPFWGAVALNTGRLLRLQGTAAATHVQRRLKEKYGERETVFRRVRYVLRSYVDWGVLKETDTKGIYGQGLILSIDDHRLIAWLIESCLHAQSNDSSSFNELINHQSLFPIRLKQIRAESLLSYSNNLDVIRHSLNDDLIMLKG
jgi:hypothetical protein